MMKTTKRMLVAVVEQMIILLIVDLYVNVNVNVNVNVLMAWAVFLHLDLF